MKKGPEGESHLLYAVLLVMLYQYGELVLTLQLLNY